jgi:hypothetical protein
VLPFGLKHCYATQYLRLGADDQPTDTLAADPQPLESKVWVRGPSYGDQIIKRSFFQVLQWSADCQRTPPGQSSVLNRHVCNKTKAECVSH